jgi:4-amino-4-deoxy-L-arabinose transferase-like glycosyltransferase
MKHIYFFGSRIKARILNGLSQIIQSWTALKTVVVLASILSITATVWSHQHGVIIAYGDAESHLNIAKRVVHSLTPGVAQLGGIWLPLPHALLVPFVSIDFLWRTGLAGSIVSGTAFVVSCAYLFRFGRLLTGQVTAGIVAFLVFALNPNVLYLQTTPMTELPLIAFFILSLYYCVSYLYDTGNIKALLLAALFGFLASLTRYDGWFLVLFEAAAVAVVHLFQRAPWRQIEGRTIIFSTLAFFGVGLWLLWDWIILGDPFYFTSSQYSAKSQQNSWFMRGELPAYHDLGQSFLYYGVTSIANIGGLIVLAAVAGLCAYLLNRQPRRILIATLLFVPFIFYVATLYIGQSVIFIPQLTPASFEFQLFNVRYGVMMIPVAAIFVGYLWYFVGRDFRFLVGLLVVLQVVLFGIGREPVITYQDGTVGLSQ